MTFLKKGNLSLLIALFLYSQVRTYSQSSSFFVKRGNNISGLSCGGALFAPIINPNHQAFGSGAIWVRNPIDLRQPFRTRFVLDFPDTTATDGGAFVFQTDTNSVGEAFNGFGYRKINHSIAITFDAVQNNYDNDPSFDHLSIQANGNLDHHSPENIAGPVSIEPLYTITPYPPPYADVKQFHHLIEVTWDPATIRLSVAIDGTPYISAQYDLIEKIFNSNPLVYWGFTASNTQAKVIDALEVTLGYMYFFFGDVIPKYTTDPVLDTCFGTPIRFIDSSIYASDYSLQDLTLFKWFWSFGDGNISSARNPSPHVYPSPGVYELLFTATNQLGCTTDTLRRIVRLGSIPKPDFNVQALCTNSATLFKDSTQVDVGIPVAWQWDFRNGNPSGEKNPVTEFTSPGIKSVTLSVSSEFGCRADTTKTIVVTDKPEGDFTYIKDCEGMVSYSPIITNNVPVNQWQWNFGDGFSSAEPGPVHHYLKNNVYNNSFIATSESGCVSDTVQKMVLINKVYPFGGNDTIVAIGQPLQLQASGGTVYSWSPATGLNNPFIDDPVAVLLQNQVYVLLVKNDDGCESRDTIYINVYKGPDLYAPTAFTPDQNGLNDFFKVTAPGLKQLDYIRVYDRWGALVFETRDIRKGWDGTLKGIEQPSGMYVWIIKAVDYRNTVLFKKGTVALIR